MNNLCFVKKVVLHDKSCDYCDKPHVDVYYSCQLDAYICDHCMKILLGETNNESIRKASKTVQKKRKRKSL